MWRKLRRDHTVRASLEILDEIEEKLRLKFGFHPRHARLLTLFVQRQTLAVEVISQVRACRDPDDNHILAAALDGNCSHLVTGDSDLLALREFAGINIVTPRAFMELISRV